jgi:photosystem II stability/assembly factor-like uncharacterized protein
MKKRLLKIKLLSLFVLLMGTQLNAQTPKTWGMVLDENISTLSKIDYFGFNGAFGFGYSPDSRVWMTHDGGQTWAFKTISGFSPAYPSKLELIKQVHYFDSLNGVFRYNQATYYKTTDGGTTLTFLSDSTFNNYTFTTLPNTHYVNQNVWYKWQRGLRLSDSKLVDVIMLTVDGGLTWSDLSNNLYSNYPSGKNMISEYVQFISATVGFVFGQEGFYKTTDGGTTWSLSNALAGSGPIDFIDANNGYVAGHFGGFKEVRFTSDGGTTFTPTTLTNLVTYPGNSQKVSEIYSVDFFDVNNGVAACNANGMPFIARTTDGGTTWIKDTISSAVLNLSLVYSGFKPIQMVSPSAAFTQIVTTTSKRYIIGFTNPSSTSIANNTASDLGLYPNPVTNGLLTIEGKGTYDVTIYNINGQIVENRYKLNGNSTIDLNSTNPGLYLVKVIGVDYSFTKKIIIK